MRQVSLVGGTTPARRPPPAAPPLQNSSSLDSIISNLRAKEGRFSAGCYSDSLRSLIVEDSEGGSYGTGRSEAVSNLAAASSSQSHSLDWPQGTEPQRRSFFNRGSPPSVPILSYESVSDSVSANREMEGDHLSRLALLEAEKEAVDLRVLELERLTLLQTQEQQAMEESHVESLQMMEAVHARELMAVRQAQLQLQSAAQRADTGMMEWLLHVSTGGFCSRPRPARRQIKETERVEGSPTPANSKTWV